MTSIFAFRLESNLLWVSRSEGQGSIRYDPSHSAPVPLPTIHLLLWSGGGVRCSHVVSGLIHPLCQLHVCKEHLPARHSAVGKRTSNSLLYTGPILAIAYRLKSNKQFPLAF